MPKINETMTTEQFKEIKQQAGSNAIILFIATCFIAFRLSMEHKYCHEPQLQKLQQIKQELKELKYEIKKDNSDVYNY